MGPYTQPTASYHEDAPIDRPRPVRVAFGSPSAANDELARQLRLRLIILGTFLAATISFLVLIALILRPTTDELVANIRWGLLIASQLAAVWILWRRPPSLWGLRILEFTLLAPVVTLLLALGISETPYRYLEWAANETEEYRLAYVGRYTNAGTHLWFVVIVSYGAIVPNSPRRAFLVTGVVAFLPIILFLVFALWLRPLEQEIIQYVMRGFATSNVIAVALVVFSTWRIEGLRREVAEARRLGQYVLHEKLGAGGMGEVYRAEHVLLRRSCALKLIRPDRADDPATLRRFEREVQATATLTHPNTVQVFDYGHTADGTFYYVMEYLPGLTLDELVRQHGPLSAARACHFLRQVCAALSEAHARGLTHRDIKPGNVMVCERGGAHDVVKVLDFGLVRLAKDDREGTVTREGTVAGTPAYMSPEQASGSEALDARSDLYSVGALAYFLLTGQPPFAQRSAMQMMAAHLYEAPPDLPASVPAELAATIRRCLAKPPAERWPDAATLETALADFASSWTQREAAAWWTQRETAKHELGTATATYTPQGA